MSMASCSPRGQDHDGADHATPAQPPQPAARPATPVSCVSPVSLPAPDVRIQVEPPQLQQDNESTPSEGSRSSCNLQPQPQQQQGAQLETLFQQLQIRFTKQQQLFQQQLQDDRQQQQLLFQQQFSLQQELLQQQLQQCQQLQSELQAQNERIGVPQSVHQSSPVLSNHQRASL